MAQHEDVEQRRAEKRARSFAKKEKLELDAAVAGLLQHPHGRRYLYFLLEISGAIGVNPFTGDSLTTAFKCGEQNVGQQIMAHIIEVNGDGFLTMLREREAERKEQENANASAQGTAGLASGDEAD